MATNPNQEIDRKIREYISLREDAKALKPKIDKLKDDIETQLIPFRIHEVMMEALTTQFGDIDAITEALEAKINFETEIYERLKGIILSLTVDQENLQILETGSFSDPGDLVEIEKELSAITVFSRGKIDLAIMKERETGVTETISSFLKRFLTFISKLPVETESSGELTVHREFYRIMQGYKFIYKFSKTNPEYYSMICLAYVRKSKNLYDAEFKRYLNNLAELSKNVASLKHATVTLVRSYESLLACENAFMTSMEIESDPAEIFVAVDSMIMDFMRLFFKRYPHYILYAMSVYTSEESIAKLGTLGRQFKKELGGLEEVFLTQQRNEEPSYETVDLINALREVPDASQLADKLTKSLIRKLQRSGSAIETQLRSLQVLRGIQTLGEDDTALVAQREDLLVEKIIGKVFGAKDETAEIKAIFSALEADRPGYSEVSAFVKRIILENCDKSKQAGFTKVIAEVTGR